MKYKTNKNFPDVIIIEPDIFYDYRGEYIETWNNENYKKINNLKFKQDNISVSYKNVLRGLHGDFKTWKLIQCVYGSLFQVIVDIRPNSETYLQHDIFNLNDKNRNQILIPPGFANGHLVMSDTSILSYKQTSLYHGSSFQSTFRWDDPKINIPWPINNPILSLRDKNAKLL
jgi:dTDP-4-dehydrorhamnose 3,5-epimerase